MSISGERVLVTGADGFIGSHLTEALVRAGARVRAFCHYNSNGSRGWLDESPPDIRDDVEAVLGDVRDARMVEAACQQVDVVFHLAALVAIPHSYRAPESFIDTNVRGTLNVLEGVRRCGVRRMIQTSTSEVYGTPDDTPIRETHPLQGQSPYSASKIGADKLCEAYHRSYGTPVAVLRPFNTYGPRQSARAVIPTILSQLLAGRHEVKLGSLSPRRDMTFVHDTVEGFIALASAEDVEGDVIQLGTGRSESIGEIFEAACAALGTQATVVQDQARVRPEESEVQVLLSDPSKARERLGWEAHIGLEEGLRRTGDWVSRNLHHFDVGAYAQ